MVLAFRQLFVRFRERPDRRSLANCCSYPWAGKFGKLAGTILKRTSKTVVWGTAVRTMMPQVRVRLWAFRHGAAVAEHIAGVGVRFLYTLCTHC